MRSWMTPLLVVMALASLGSPASAHLSGWAPGGSACADDGQAHVHPGGFGGCASVPSACPGDAACTPYVCVYYVDFGPPFVGTCSALP